MLIQIVVFLADALCGFFAGLCLLRFLMQAMRVSFAGPLGHFVLSLSDWAVKPLRRVIPPAAGYDSASLVAALAIEGLFAGLLFGLQGGALPDPATTALLLLWATLKGLLRLAVHLFIAALILQAILSWVSPYSPLAAPAAQLTRPLLAPIRRILPPLSGIDLSPLVGILLLQVVLMLL